MIARRDAHYLDIALIAAISNEKEVAPIKDLISNIQRYNVEYPPQGRQPSLTNLGMNDVNVLSFALTVRKPQVVNALLDSGAFDHAGKILFSRNSDGQTLICQATEQNYDEIVNRLFNLTNEFLKNTSIAKLASMVFDLTFYQKQQLSMNDLITMLQRDSGKFWATEDNKKNTPLHYAVMLQHTGMFNLFIHLLSKQDDHATHINWANENKNTPLHLVMRNDLDTDFADALLTQGADLALRNENRETPFGLLRRRNANAQLAWLQQLSADNRKKFIPHYKAYLVDHPDDKETRKIFYTLVSTTQTLLDLAAAHLEVDPKVKIRNSYYEEVREDGFNLRVRYRHTPSDEQIKKDIALKQNIVYLYLEGSRIKMASRDNDGNIQRISIDNNDGGLKPEVYYPIKEVLQDVLEKKTLAKRELEALAELAQFHGYNLLITKRYSTHIIRKTVESVNDPELVKRLPRYLKKLSAQNVLGFGATADSKPDPEALFTQDKDTLSDLIADTEAYLQDIATRQPGSIYKKLAIIIPLTAWLLYGAIETWLIIATVNESWNPTFSDNHGNPLPFLKDMPYETELPSYNGTWCENNYWKEMYRYKIEDNYNTYYKSYAGYCHVTNDIHFWPALGVGAVGVLINLISTCILGYKLRNYPTTDPTISHNEMREHVHALQEHVLDKLDRLQDNDIPVDPLHINALVDEISQINSSKPKSEAQQLFTRINTLLKTLRDDLDKSHKPFSTSLFQPYRDNREVVIDMPDDKKISADILLNNSSDDDEFTPLLKRS